MVTQIDLGRARAELGSAMISDILDARGLRSQCLGTGLTLLDQSHVIAGWAFPVVVQRVFSIPDRPFQGLLAALDSLQPDDVFMTPTQRATDIAVWGELLSTAAIARGAAGAVTDGLMRDTRQVEELQFPVVSAGTIPYDSKGRHEIVAHGVPIRIDGVSIEPGDLVFADRDGVVIAPRAIAADVIGEALDKRAKEREFKVAVAAGMSVTEAFAKFQVL